MINVMYHYVRPDNKEYMHFNNLNLNQFKRQLDYFEKEYGFISQQDYINAIKKKKNIDGVVLTFDDGFKDHYTYVLPELKARGLWALFYISTGIYAERKLLNVHRVHYLKGKYGARQILDEITHDIKDYMLDHKKIKEFDKEIYLQSSYEEDEKKLRRLLNYYIKYEYLNPILDRLMKKLFDEDKLFDEVYLNTGEIKDLVMNGNIVGSHTLSHSVLSRLSYSEQQIEIEESFNFIDKIVFQEYKSFCFPYGYSTSYNNDTLKILKKLNIDDACIFDNKKQGAIIKKYELSRIDCNQFMEV